MKNVVCLKLCLLSIALPSAAETGVHSSIRLDSAAASNRIVISWETVPEHFYQVRSATALGEPWTALHLSPLPAGPGQFLLSIRDQHDQPHRFYRVFDLDVPTNLALVVSGTFTMGSPASEAERNNNEGPLTRVTISHDFWMARHEVTQAQYQEVTGTNPSYFNGVRGATDYGTDLRRPVEQVTWDQATNYCALLTARERQAGRVPEGYLYRLPTEAEWEYACRAGSVTAFHYGSALRSGMANFRGTNEYNSAVGTVRNPSGAYVQQAVPVGSYAPNSWGLQDMHGNVWEWCSDWWGPELPGGSVTNPVGAVSGVSRMIRGGSWTHDGRMCRSAYRISFGPSLPARDIGFRVVLAPPLP